MIAFSRRDGIDIPNLNRRIDYISLPGTGEPGKNICSDIETRIAERIRYLKKEGYL